MVLPDLVAWRGGPCIVAKRRFVDRGFFLGFWDDHGRK
jgi:hypothetical protein